MTGCRTTRIWVPKDDIFTPRHKTDWLETTVDNVDWATARVAVICECRNIWLQTKMFGITIDARDIYVYPEDNSCPFTSASESDEE